MEYNFTIQHKINKYQITLPDSTKLSLLGLKIQELTNIVPKCQKLIYKGKKIETNQNEALLKDTFGSELNIKMTLIGSSTTEILSCTNTGKNIKTGKPNEAEKKQQSIEWKHEKIIQRIKPEFELLKKGTSFIDGQKGANEPLPKHLSNVFNEEGKPVRMVFHPDKRELWIANNEETQKIPFDDIRNIVVEPIPQQDNFTAIGIQIGTDPNKDLIWYFYIPVQFEKSIRYTLLGNLSFPFLHSTKN